MNEKVYIETKEELNAAMQEQDLSRADLAEAIGVTPQAVWRWTNGQVRLPQYAAKVLYLDFNIQKSVAS